MNNRTFAVYSTKLSYLWNGRLFISFTFALVIYGKSHLENQVIKWKMSLLYLENFKNLSVNFFYIFLTFLQMNYRNNDFLFNFDVNPSQEVLQLDKAIVETQRIEAQLLQVLRNIKRLSMKFKTPTAREYFSFFEAPAERHCENGDHLTWNGCSLINEQSHNDDSNLPQNHQQTCEEITNDDYNPTTTTTTSSFFNKIINHNQSFLIAK